MYKIIYSSFERAGLHFLEDTPNERNLCESIDCLAKEYQTVEEALKKVHEMIKKGTPEPAIRIVKVIPFEINLSCIEKAAPIGGI